MIKHENIAKRISYRADLTDKLIHLTEDDKGYRYQDGTFCYQDLDALDRLIKILIQKRLFATGQPLKGAGPEGITEPVVCFHDIPLCMVNQENNFLEVYQKEHPNAPNRIKEIGLSFDKNYIFRCGGRPVIYDDGDILNHLSNDQFWRVVRYVINDYGAIDFTHEREWRFLGDFEFTLEKTSLILPNDATLRNFELKWKEVTGENSDISVNFEEIYILTDIN